MGDSLLVLPRRERVHGTELLAPARQPLDARLEIGAAVVVQGVLERLDPLVGGIAGQPADHFLTLALDLARGVADLLGSDLRGRQRVAGVAELRLDLRPLAG